MTKFNFYIFFGDKKALQFTKMDIEKQQQLQKFGLKKELVLTFMKNKKYGL